MEDGGKYQGRNGAGKKRSKAISYHAVKIEETHIPNVLLLGTCKGRWCVARGQWCFLETGAISTSMDKMHLRTKEQSVLGSTNWGPLFTTGAPCLG